MRNALLTTLTISTLVALPALPASAQFCDPFIHNVFDPGCTPPCDQFWDRDENWSDGEQPDCDDIACIPAGFETGFSDTCQDVQVKALLMEGPNGELVGSRFELENGCDLILCSGTPSTIDGSLILLPASSAGDLVIAADLTINGTGDIQVGTKIRDDGGATRYKLTIEDKDCGSNQEDLDDDCALVVHGNDGYIEVRLENNAIVSAEACVVGPGQGDVGLNLTVNEKDGHGIWRAQCGGTLIVSTEVSGIGKWHLPNLQSGGRILIKDCLQDLTGPVEISRGTFEAEQSFCTEGEMIWEFDGGSSFITVHKDKQVMFSMADCTSLLLCP